jgi:hypothetical protein
VGLHGPVQRGEDVLGVVEAVARKDHSFACGFEELARTGDGSSDAYGWGDVAVPAYCNTDDASDEAKAFGCCCGAAFRTQCRSVRAFRPDSDQATSEGPQIEGACSQSEEVSLSSTDSFTDQSPSDQRHDKTRFTAAGWQGRWPAIAGSTMQAAWRRGCRSRLGGSNDV